MSQAQARANSSDTPQFSPIYRNKRFYGALFVHPKDDSFHVSILPVATFFQFFALMPACGISQRDPKSLKFKWTSIRVIYTLANILCGVITAILYFTNILKRGISARAMGIDKVHIITISTVCLISFRCRLVQHQPNNDHHPFSVNCNKVAGTYGGVA